MQTSNSIQFGNPFAAPVSMDPPPAYQSSVRTPQGYISKPAACQKSLQQQAVDYACDSGKSLYERVIVSAKGFLSGLKIFADEACNVVHRTVYGTGLGFMAGSGCALTTYIGLGLLFGVNPVVGSIATGMSIGMVGLGAAAGAITGATYPLLRTAAYQLIEGNFSELRQENANLQLQLQQQRQATQHLQQSDQLR
ncbi:MAG: hypothetical protein OXD32_09040 [Endozoicomonadaceae bacterium]|nr:hypothetical protein [Endozoicomonadaceae bacterium]MCY4329438.1 hypothetical protein [Endozoicomonadaceae bacterium]